MISIAILLVAAIVSAGIVFSFVKEFREAQGTTWERTIEAAKDSATVLWSYLLTFAGTILGWSVYGADYLNLPEVRTFIETNVKAEYLASAMVVIGVVTLMARLRTLVAR